MGKLITIVVLLAVSGGAFMQYIRPTYDHTQEVKVKVARLDEALSKTRNIRRVRESLSSRFAEFPESKIERLQKMLPDHVDNVRLVLDMDGIASQYGMRLQNVSVQNSKKPSTAGNDAALGAQSPGSLVIGGSSDEPFQSLVLQFEVEATYEEFLLFMGDLESSLRIVNVEKLSMSPVGNDTSEGEPKYKYNLSLRTYWLK